MSTIQEIEKAIEQLSKEELHDFRTWFEKFEAKEWDQEIVQDIDSGKLDSLAAEALSEYKNGAVKKI